MAKKTKMRLDYKLNRRELLKAGVVAAAGGLGWMHGMTYPLFKTVDLRGDDILKGKFLKQKREYKRDSDKIIKRHWDQTPKIVSNLKKKYEKPVFGKINTIDVLNLLGRCIDPTDHTLFTTSQLVHTLQVIEAMEEDGIKDKDMLIAALVHDVGKVLLLTKEKPENVIGTLKPMKAYSNGIGLSQVLFQWCHDEFGYDRLKTYLPRHVSWLIRFHGIGFKDALPYMDSQDRKNFERYLLTFRKYDQGAKSMYKLPAKRLEDYEKLIHEFLPKEIVI